MATKPIDKPTSLYDFTAEWVYLPPDDLIDAQKAAADKIAIDS